MDPAWTALALSLKVALCATVIDLVLGIAAGWLLAHRRFVGRDLLESVLTLPMVLPPTVLGYYLLVVVGRRGWLGGWLHDVFGIELIFTWQGAVLAAAVVAFPLVLKAARAAFEGVDPQFERAARVLGLPEWALFARVTLPLAWRGILSGVLLAFARALGEFGATITFVSNIPGETETLPLAIYSLTQVPGGDAQAWRLSVIAVVLSVLALVTSEWLTARTTRAKSDDRR